MQKTVPRTHGKLFYLFLLPPPPPPSLSGILSCVAKKLGGKAIWLSLLVALMFSLSYSPQVKAQCGNTDLCPSVMWWGGNMSVTLPMFPGCYVVASMLYKKCPDGKLQIRITQMSFPSGCTAMQAWLAANTSNYGILYEQVLDRTAATFFINEFALDTNNASMICPNGRKSYISYLSGCNRYCRYDDYTENMTRVVPQECGGGNCCAVENTICHNPLTGLDEITKTVTTISSSGLTCSLPTMACPSFITVISSVTGGGTYQVALSSSTGCIPSSCYQ